MSRPDLESPSHEVTCSCGGLEGAKASQPLPRTASCLTSTPRRQSAWPRRARPRGGQADPQPSPKLFRFPPGGFDFPRLMVWVDHTWPSNLVEDCHPVAGSSRVAPRIASTNQPTNECRSIPTESGQHSTGLQQPRKSRNLPDQIISNLKPFPRSRLPQQSNMPWTWRSWLNNMGLDTIFPDKWEEKDGRTTWRQIFGNKCF